MTLPVSTPEFWKERLDVAKREGHLHYSVYLANPRLWEAIFNAHRKIIEKEISPEDKVLDAGCGYGRLSVLFENYVGVDISPDLLDEARVLYPGKTFIEGNLKKLPFKNGEFDVVICDSIRGMIRGNLGLRAWALIEKELRRVGKKVLILEYGDTIEGSPEKYEIL